VRRDLVDQHHANGRRRGHNNYFSIGGSIDHSKIGFQANSELGYVFLDLFVGPNAAVPGTGQIIHTAANLGFSPVSLDAQNTYYGVYANETFDVTTRLSFTAGARYNLAKIAMGDLLGTPESGHARAWLDMSGMCRFCCKSRR
jgi:iron complex outermembrane receptor protein